MIKLTEQERGNIKAAVKQAEKKTSGEFVTVIARQSDSYVFIPPLWSALLTMFVPPVMIFLLKKSDAKLIFDIQVLTFVVLYLLFQIPFLKLMLIPGGYKKIQAQKMAMQQFYIQGVSSTVQRAGILLFVSYAERYVEIIADEGINKLVDSSQWQIIVDEFIDHVKNNQVGDGFITAIDKCSSILATHFPLEKGDVNELSDKLIEI